MPRPWRQSGNQACWAPSKQRGDNRTKFSRLHARSPSRWGIISPRFVHHPSRPRWPRSRAFRHRQAPRRKAPANLRPRLGGSCLAPLTLLLSAATSRVSAVACPSRRRASAPSRLQPRSGNPTRCCAFRRNELVPVAKGVGSPEGRTIAAKHGIKELWFAPLDPHAHRACHRGAKKPAAGAPPAGQKVPRVSAAARRAKATGP